jgi:hypothetical protein
MTHRYRHSGSFSGIVGGFAGPGSGHHPAPVYRLISAPQTNESEQF